MTPEQIFYYYAFPCLRGLVEKGKLSTQDYDELSCLRENNQAPRRVVLVKLFDNAVAEMEKLYGEDFWDVEKIREFFLVHHNRLIERRSGRFSAKMYDSPLIRAGCYVFQLEVLEKKVGFLGSPDWLLVANKDGSTKIVSGEFIFQQVKEGDIVAIHHSVAIEVIK